ncbi:N-acetylglucosamine-6-phosphate deacetylase [Natronogracilivirga saccharolytica]|uniref:Amidohydrolase family protein n=1 Tax=Natronogracilivirga saccharolytica TaxID=2812953 RepID=A0A8J7UW00_9BACT|nr:amidohydrolase family protein [Natronogracilivirga saccharolytica]MBP3193970.1 amidohydrolase family protein [Natronogracilivirga saccharolytica]
MNIPGFVDLQVNGYKGIDFSSPDLDEEDFYHACKELISNGTVVFLPTIITSSRDVFQRNLGLMANVIKDINLRDHIPGFHIEGPFISPEDGARGAHNKDWVYPPDKKYLDDLFKWSDEKIKMLTMAAESPGSDELCQYATSLGITISLGHQMADDGDMKKLSDAGAQALTHLGNGIPREIDRHLNPLWAGLSNDRLTAMIIADGHHLPESVLKVIIRGKGISNICVVSDASPIAGLKPGKYNTLGNDVVLDETGKLYNPRTGYLVGSSYNMIQCANYLLSCGIMAIDSIVETTFYNPLRLINLDPKEVKMAHRSFLNVKCKIEL